MKTINNIFITLIRGYQAFISPIIHRSSYSCIYKEPCSEYAIRQLQEHNILMAMPMSIWRILSCNPINARRISKKTSQSSTS